MRAADRVRGPKDLGGRERNPRVERAAARAPARPAIRLDPLADSAHPGGPRIEEEGHVGAQFEGDPGQRAARDRALPGRPRTSARNTAPRRSSPPPRPAAGRDSLAEPDDRVSERSPAALEKGPAAARTARLRSSSEQRPLPEYRPSVSIARLTSARSRGPREFDPQLVVGEVQRNEDDFAARGSRPHGACRRARGRSSASHGAPTHLESRCGQPLRGFRDGGSRSAPTRHFWHSTNCIRSSYSNAIRSASLPSRSPGSPRVFSDIISSVSIVCRASTRFTASAGSRPGRVVQHAHVVHRRRAERDHEGREVDLRRFHPAASSGELLSPNWP